MSIVIHGLDMPKRSCVTVLIYPDGTAVVTPVSKRKFMCSAQNVPKSLKSMLGWKEVEE